MKLIDLIKPRLDLGSYKYHLAQTAEKQRLYHPLQQFYNGTFGEWQRRVSKKIFQVDHVISLIEMEDKDRWLFAGVWERSGEPERVTNKKECEGLCSRWDKDSKDCTPCYLYEMREVEEFEDDLTGRVVVNYHNINRVIHRYPITVRKDGTKNFEDALIVEKMFSERKRMPDPVIPFVTVSFKDLKTIMDKGIQTWKDVLSSSKGIYCITDTSNGKLYIGQAKTFWDRWDDYVNNTDKCNALMIEELIEKNGMGYAKNFQFTVLERCGDAQDLGERENFWKDIFKTREHGYNEREGTKKGKD